MAKTPMTEIHYDDLSFQDVRDAQGNIRGMACVTPLKPSFSLSKRLGTDVLLKMENMQDSGSFKIRGAANKILSLSDDERARGVVTASSGNHGKSVAMVAKQLGIRAVICLTGIVPEGKVAAIRDLGAEIVIHGTDQDQASEKAHEIEQREGLTFVSPFDDLYVIAGQGTIGLEILDARPDIETLIVQVSGGGLMSGIALVARTIKPDITLIGVSTEHGAAMIECIRAGHIVPVEEKPSIADALPGPIQADNRYTFPMCRDLVDEIMQVSDTQIEQAMVHALKHEKIVLEGGGAAAIALLLDDRAKKFKGPIAAICSGDNVAIEKVMALSGLQE